jgi:hypothetical protein
MGLDCRRDSWAGYTSLSSIRAADATKNQNLRSVPVRTWFYVRMIKYSSAEVYLTTDSSGSVATIARIPYIALGSSENILVATNAAIFWSIIELTVNIILTSAATFKPLMVKLGLIKPPFGSPRSSARVNHWLEPFDSGTSLTIPTHHERCSL